MKGKTIVLAAIMFLGLLSFTPGALATSDLVKLATPSTTPAGTLNSMAFSPDGGYFAVGSTTSPFLLVYQLSGSGSGTTFTKLSNPASGPGGNVRGVAWDPTGQYVAVTTITAYDGTNYLTIFKVVGTTVTKCQDPSNPAGGSGFAVRWSGDGNYIAVADSITPFIEVFYWDPTRCSDPSYSALRLAAPSPQPSGTCVDLAFSADAAYLAVGCTGTPAAAVYQRSGSLGSATFSRLTAPGTVPDQTPEGVSWSWDGSTVAFATDSSATRSIHAWGVSGSTLTALTFPTAYKSNFNDANWSSNGVLIVAADGAGSPGVTLTSYTRSGTSMVEISPSTGPTARSARWAPNPAYVAMALGAGSGSSCGVSENLREDSYNGASFTRLTSASDPCPQAVGPPTAAIDNALAWSPTGLVVAVQTGTVSPYFNAFSTTTGQNIVPPTSPTLTTTMTGLPLRCVLTWTTPTAGSSPILGYNITRTLYGTSLISVGVLNTYSDFPDTATVTYNVTAFSAAGNGTTSNNATCRIPPQRLTGETGTIYGGAGRTSLASAWGVPAAGLDLILSLIVIMLMAAMGAIIVRAYPLVGGMVGGAIGFILCIALGLMPVWVLLFFGIAVAAVFGAARIFGGGSGG